VRAVRAVRAPFGRHGSWEREGRAIDGPTALRTTLLGGLPLVVVDLPAAGVAVEVRSSLLGAGLARLPAFLGFELPRGARVAVHVVAEGLRVVDEAEVTLLRAPRSGVDADWVRRARELKGTMLVVTSGLDLAPLEGEGELAAGLDGAAREGHAIGAVVGFHDEPVRLPLLLG